MPPIDDQPEIILPAHCMSAPQAMAVPNGSPTSKMMSRTYMSGTHLMMAAMTHSTNNDGRQVAKTTFGTIGKYSLTA
jgi:hypothetical protein